MQQCTCCFSISIFCCFRLILETIDFTFFVLWRTFFVLFTLNSYFEIITFISVSIKDKNTNNQTPKI